MKTTWLLTYELIYAGTPSAGVQTKKYASFAKARAAVRALTRQVDPSPYACEMRKRGGDYAAYRRAMADLLEAFFTREDAREYFGGFPSSDAADYATGEEEEDEPEEFEIDIGEDDFFFRYRGGAYPHIETNTVTMADETQDYRFSFYTEEAETGTLGELQITLSPIHSFGTSAYPLLILRTLEEAIAPMDQRELIAQIQRTHGVTPERKAVGRNVALLKALGYDIRRERGGYVLLRESGSLTEGELRLLTDSVLANAALTADEREALIEKLLTL